MQAFSAWASSIALILSTGCGASQPDDPGRARSGSSTIDLVSDHDTGRSASERARFVASTQEGAGPEYALRMRARGQLQAEPSSALPGVSFELGRVLVGASDSPSESFDLSASAFGCAGVMTAVSAVEPVRVRANRVEYSRAGGLVEWYVNGPLGLEQGFTINELPECAQRGDKLLIRLAANTGWQVLLSADPRRAQLRGPHGGRLRYEELHVEDARQRVLPARIVNTTGIGLEVDVSQAELPLVVDPLVWADRGKLTVADGAPGDSFGASVSINGDTALIGAAGDDDQGDMSGSAFVYVRSGADFVLQKKLVPLAFGDEADDRFGCSVSVSGDTALVGAYGYWDFRGAAYVFVRSGTNWIEQRRLSASDTAQGDAFGDSVALSGNTALVGAPGDEGYTGAAYAFVRTGTSWTQQRKFTAAITAGGSLGDAVALNGDTAMLGAPFTDDINAGSGTAFVFVRSGTNWTQQGMFTSAEGSLGLSLTLSGETALAGASGSATVFVRNGTSWSTQQKLSAADGETAFDNFGGSVSVSGQMALIGATGDEPTGSAYVFVRSGTSWTQQTKLTAFDTASGGGLGSSVALDGSLAVVGAAGDDDLGSGAGAAYVFAYGASNGTACSLGTECATGYCVEGVCCDGACASACDSCLAARKVSGADGECGLIEAGTDPKNACTADAASTCDQDGLCDGAGACALYAAETACDPSSCPTETSENPSDTCDGAGSCTLTGVVACAAGYRCISGACKTSCASDDDCDTQSAFGCFAGACKQGCADNEDCDSAGGFECIAAVCQIPLAQPCSQGVDCETGHCADGLCCDTACEGLCEACAEAGAEGECIAIDGAPRGERPACEVVGEAECGASCDGEHRAECQFVPATTLCASSCSEDTESSSECDGQGHCVDQPSRKCTPYVCAESACLADCATNDDCATGFRCVNRVCTSGAACSSDGTSSTGSDGTTECGAYRCDVATGACRSSCVATSDCTSGHVCNPTSKSCERVEDRSEDDGGCGCRVAVPRRRTGELMIVLLALGFARRSSRVSGVRRALRS